MYISSWLYLTLQYICEESKLSIAVNQIIESLSDSPKAK